MNESEEALIRSVAAGATPGPWERVTYGHKDRRSQLRAVGRALHKRVPGTDLVPTDLTWVECEGKTVALVGNGPMQTENGDFIAVARDAIPMLIAELDAARDALAVIHEMCKPQSIDMSGTPRWFDGNTPAGGGSRERIWRICDAALAKREASK